MNKYFVDVCIPAYNEKGYIETTLDNLTDQTLYKKDKVHIVIGDFKDKLNLDDYYIMDLCKKYKHVTYLPVFQKGIAITRNTIIKQKSITDIILNFDADSVFNREDAIEKMIHPIISGDRLLTNCECILFDFAAKRRAEKPIQNFYEALSYIGTGLEKSFVARGPGLTVDKKAFYSVGGFREIPVMEDYFLAWDIIYKYSIHAKQYVDEVKVLSSDRRSKAIAKDGLHIFNYTDNSYR